MMNKITTTRVFFKKTQLNELARKKTMIETTSQIVWRSKKCPAVPVSVGRKEFIVTRPAQAIKKTLTNKIQSIFLPTDLIEFFKKEKNIK